MGHNNGRPERQVAGVLIPHLGDFALAALTPHVIAGFRDERLAEGKSPDTVRIELAVLSHLFTTAIREWRLGLVYNPALNIRKPSGGAVTGR